MSSANGRDNAKTWTLNVPMVHTSAYQGICGTSRQLLSTLSKHCVVGGEDWLSARLYWNGSAYLWIAVHFVHRAVSLESFIYCHFSYNEFICAQVRACNCFHLLDVSSAVRFAFIYCLHFNLRFNGTHLSLIVFYGQNTYYVHLFYAHNLNRKIVFGFNRLRRPLEDLLKTTSILITIWTCIQSNTLQDISTMYGQTIQRFTEIRHSS